MSTSSRPTSVAKTSAATAGGDPDSPRFSSEAGPRRHWRTPLDIVAPWRRNLKAAISGGDELYYRESAERHGPALNPRSSRARPLPRASALGSDAARRPHNTPARRERSARKGGACATAATRKSLTEAGALAQRNRRGIRSPENFGRRRRTLNYRRARSNRRLVLLFCRNREEA